MEKKLNLAQVFVAAKAFLDIAFFKNFSDDIDSYGLDIVLAGFAINKCKEDWQSEPETWDPSVWLDWIKASNEIMVPEIVDTAVTLVSPLQGYRIMKKYIENFANEFEFEDLLLLFKRLGIDQKSDFLHSLEWKYWLLCIDSTINKSLSIDGSLISLNEKILSKEQALQVMQIFLQKHILLLDEKLEKSLRKLNFEKLEGNIFFNIWLELYNKVVNNQNGKIKIIDAYNIMRLSLEEYFKNNKLKFYVIKKLLSVDDKQLPIEYKIWYSWLNATYAVLLP